MIVSVRFHGTEHSADLTPGRTFYTIGSAGANLIVPPSLARGVAPIHAFIEHAEGRLGVLPHERGPSLYRSAWTAEVGELILPAGVTGWIGGAAITPLDAGLNALRPRLAWSMGLDAHPAVDAALVTVASREPLLLVGPEESDARALIAAIHATDPEAGPLLTAPDGLPPPFPGATLVVDLDALPRLSRPRVVALLTPQRSQRVIFRASAIGRARLTLDNYNEHVRTVRLPPLAHRGDEIPRLVERVWVAEIGSRSRVVDLDARTLHGLCSHRWRGFHELRVASRRVLAYHECGGLRPAAVALGISHQSLAGYLDRIGVATGGADREPPPLFAYLIFGWR